MLAIIVPRHRSIPESRCSTNLRHNMQQLPHNAYREPSSHEICHCTGLGNIVYLPRLKARLFHQLWISDRLTSTPRYDADRATRVCRLSSNTKQNRALTLELGIPQLFVLDGLRRFISCSAYSNCFSRGGFGSVIKQVVKSGAMLARQETPVK